MIVWDISGHGFGHAARDVEVLNVLGERLPGIAVTVRKRDTRTIFPRNRRLRQAFFRSSKTGRTSNDVIEPSGSSPTCAISSGSA